MGSSRVLILEEVELDEYEKKKQSILERDGITQEQYEAWRKNQDDFWEAKFKTLGLKWKRHDS